MDLHGRLVVISGASSGIGAAAGRAFARKGARLVLIARTRAALERIAGEIAAAGGIAFVRIIDLTDGQTTAAEAKGIETDIGVPEVVVNCAGAGKWLFAEETTPAEAVAMAQVPYLAAFFLTSAFLPSMMSRGSGRIVNVNSPAAFSPWPGATGYASARWALRGFSEALRVDLRGTGVGVTQVVAGECESEYWAHNPNARERLPKISRYFRTLTPAEVANGIVGAVEQERSMAVMPFSLAVVLALNRFWPWPVRALMASTGYAHAPRDRVKD